MTPTVRMDDAAAAGIHGHTLADVLSDVHKGMTQATATLHSGTASIVINRKCGVGLMKVI